MGLGWLAPRFAGTAEGGCPTQSVQPTEEMRGECEGYDYLFLVAGGKESSG